MKGDLVSVFPLTVTHGQIEQVNNLLKLFQFFIIFPSPGKNFPSAH